MSDFHDQVIAASLKARASSTMHSGNDLVLPEASIFGGDAGADYADYIIEHLKAFILLEAQSKRTEVSFYPHNMGPRARDAFLAGLSRHLADFNVRWEHHALKISW